ncbi:MAG: AsmA-like C-terminal domain-containing protein [Rickettsiales bacterium]
MVKYLKHLWLVIKRFVLLGTLAILALGFWLHAGERSLSFAKPFITDAVNDPAAPYVISIGDVTIDWRNAAELGKLHITSVTFAKRDGSIFMRMPDIYTTVDPIGFLPTRHLLHTVTLREPRLFITRNAENVVELGIDGAESRIALSELLAFFASEETDAPFTPPRLPFHDFSIDNATLTFTDANTATKIISTPFDFRLSRHRRSYDAELSMPFTVDDVPVKLTAGLRTVKKVKDHVLAVQFANFPARLVCLFGTCPDAMSGEGPIDGTIAMGIADDLSVHQFSAKLSTRKALFTAPKLFAEPLKLGMSSINIAGDWSKKEINLPKVELTLEDTTIAASAKLKKAEDGWYATANGETGRLDITKVYKYWPLVMAPDSRTWITNKLKSGYAAKGTLKLNITPTDLAGDFLSDKSVDATADAREITFEYLPGFPLVEKMNGIAHFTGTTVKVEGSGGNLMTGTKINHAILWCPELNTPSNPMEATIDLTAPAADAVTMLNLKHFPFDDKFGLNTKTIKGTVDANMKLKFNAFSNNPNSDPNEIHLEAVDYDIQTKITNLAQDNVYGGYNASSVSGTLNASNAGIDIVSSIILGESGINDIKLSQPTGKPLSLSVKGRAATEGSKVPAGRNDFALSYSGGAVPDISITGKRLDASVAYGGAENSLLANFPAMKLNIDLGEFLLADGVPFTDVKGNMICSAARCESANFTAMAGNSNLKATIGYEGGQRHFAMTANDAGATLKAFDITDRMTRGKLSMEGDYDDKKTPPQLDARLIINDFTLQNSQVLGRILSIASLTGVANALTGSGIDFEKLSANIASQGGLMSIDKGMANGAAIGITIAGTVDTNTSKLNLKGVLVPAYALNSIVGKIPVIGLLAGGEGEGLIGFNFSVRGSYADPDVMVNPLSGLTPGFLRGIFGVFDGKAPKTPGAKTKAGTPLSDTIPRGIQKR